MARATKKTEHKEPPTLSGTPKEIAAQIRRALKDGGSAEHAAGVQWFFKEEIKSHGWYTAALRRAIRRCRREILREHDFQFLTEVADQLFSGPVLEEKIAGIFLLEELDAQCGDRDFAMFERGWTGSAVSRSHDGLVHSHRADGGGETGSDEICIPLGEVFQSLASSGGLRGASFAGRGQKMFFLRL
jgi:hypothetical protein